MKNGIHPDYSYIDDNPCESCRFNNTCRYASDDYQVEECKEWVGKEN